MEDLKLKVKAFQADLRTVTEALAAKHGLTLKKNFLRYDEYQFKSSLVFNVNGKEEALNALTSSLYKASEDPNVGTTVYYRRTGYKVTGYNRNGTLLADRCVDGRGFKFKRSKLTGKYDYFDQSQVVA